MRDQKGEWKQHLKKSMKIAVTAVLAIAIAGEISLQNPATAGIITVLSIRSTKRETLQSARNRALAFLVAVVLGYVCFGLLGYTLWGFALYLLLFALVCLWADWGEALAPASVLISHFLIAGNMGPTMLWNECLLFGVGTGLGILVNLHLRPKEEEFLELVQTIDGQMQGIWQRMARWLVAEDKSGYGPGCFEQLDRTLEKAGQCAAANYNNTIRHQSSHELEYVRRRRMQRDILEEIYVNIKHISYLPEQAKQVAGLLEKMAEMYEVSNEPKRTEQARKARTKELSALLADMKQQDLPVTREEFEARALLFYILMQIKNYLQT